MILIDTNVISELLRAEPARAVLDWFGMQQTARLFFSAVGEAELRAGAAILPPGRRRDVLTANIDTIINADFARRVLPFDGAASKAFASIAADRRVAGRPISQADCQIAAIARVLGATVATRNISDFEGCGIGIVDPWQSHAAPR